MKKRLTEVGILTFDLAAAGQAWSKTMGLELQGGRGEARMAVGDVLVRFLSPESGAPAAEALAEHGEGLHDLTIEVDDVVDAMLDLRVKDVLVSGVSIGADGKRQVTIDPRSTHGVPIRLVERQR